MGCTKHGLPSYGYVASGLYGVCACLYAPLWPGRPEEDHRGNSVLTYPSLASLTEAEREVPRGSLNNGLST